MTASLKRILPFALLLAAGAAAYWPSFGGGFVWDDAVLITENPFIKAWDRTLSTFSPEYWKHFSPRPGGKYRPLRNVSFTFDYTFWRLDPRGYRLTNFALHFAAAALLLLFARRLFGGGDAAAVSAPLLAAAAFVSYPRVMESVAWIKNRGDMMAAVCLLYGLLLISDKARRLELKLAALFCLGLFSKESAAGIPLIWGLYMYLFPSEQVPAAGRLRPLAPVLALLLAYAAFMLWLGAAGNLASSGGSAVALVLGAFRELGAYGWLTLFPYGVNPVREIPGALYAAALPLLALPAAIGLYRKDRVLLFIGLWLPASLLIAMLPLESRPLADQRAYLACLGAALLAAYALKNSVTQKMFLASFIFLNIIIIGHNVKVYAEEKTLWEYSFARNPANSTVLLNLGKVYLALGDRAKAESLLKRAVSPDERGAYAYNNLGVLAQQEGDLAKAVSMFDMAVSLDPNYFEPYLNRGGIRFLQGDQAKALADWETAKELSPNRPEVYNNLGLYYASQGLLVKAKDFFYEATVIDPEFVQARENLVVVHKKLGQLEMMNEELYRISRIKARRQVVSTGVKAD